MAEERKVLVVDDNQEFCQNVKDILEMKDYAVSTARDGFQALKLVEGDSFDVVLMDVKMPGMDGLETFKKLKTIAPQVAVIMVTAFAVEDLIREALQEGAFGSMGKPLDFGRLFELIERAAGNGALILIADDDKELCSNMEDILSQKGYRVCVAHDGDAAIQKTQENNFDIVLIDMKLPPLNGLQTYLAIKNIRPDAVAIIITGYPQQVGDLMEQALQGNAYSCLEKPIDMEELVSLLDQIKEQKAKDTLKKPG